jgi:hypothetical protein
MKATNKIAPAILRDPDAVKIYQVTVDLGNERWAELNYSEKTWATEEYNRIKSQGIYCGTWIKSITLNEHATRS